MTDKQTKLARRRARAAEKRKTDQRIRVDDRVLVLEPKIVIRCGYPMGHRVAVREIMDKHGADLEEFMRKLGIRFDPDNRAHRRVLDELSYVYRRVKGFGGPERSIFTEDRPELTGKECVVVGRRVVTTGVYYAPSGGYDPWGESDYDPGGLSDPQHHVLFHIQPRDYTIRTKDELWIEAKHLQKIVPLPAANQSELIPF